MANILTNAISSIAAFFNRQKTALIGTTWGVGTKEVYPDIDTTRAITLGFNNNTAVYAIVKKDAKKFGSIPRYVEAGKEGKADAEHLEGPLADLINRPNPDQSSDAFLSLVRAFYKICGESFIWLNRGDTSTLVNDALVEVSDEVQMTKPILEMYVLPANRVIVVPDDQNIFGVYGYILESSVRIPIRKVDIIHWKDLNLEFDVVSKQHLRGMPALRPGFKTLEQNNSATDSSVRMYQNDGAKGVLSNKTLSNMSPQQETALRHVIDKKINNIDVKGAVAALQGDWSYMDISKDSVDMELLKGKEMSMKELCFLFGLPYELFDSGVTWSNKEMAQKGWVINEIMPDCKQLDGELNRMLLPAFGLQNSARICSDFDELPELQQDKKDQVEWLMKAPVTPNEVREALGYEPVTDPGADEIYIPSGWTPLDATNSNDAIMQEIQQMQKPNQMPNGVGKNGNGKIPKNA